MKCCLPSRTRLLGAVLLGLLTSCYSQWDEDSKQPPPYRIDPTPVCSLSAPITGFTCPRSSLPGIGVIPGCCSVVANKCGADTTPLGGGCLAFDSAEYQAVYLQGNPPVHCNGIALDGWESACRAALRAATSGADAGSGQDAGGRTRDGGLRDAGMRDAGG